VVSNQPLFTPYRMGNLDLPNRIVMAPLTRMRAQSHDCEQRASAGLIITEATETSPEGLGWADTPGLWTKEQVRGWRLVTDAVHAPDGRIFAQLRHTGRILPPERLGGAQPVSASKVDPGQISVTPAGRKPTVVPRALTKQEIQVTVRDLAPAARNAIEAGSDGAQILANDLYLISQFLNAATDLRKDEYGGNLANRSRFLFEVIDSVLGEVNAQRVGVKIRPIYEGVAFRANNETLPVTEYAIPKLSTYNLSHLLLVGNTTDFSGTPLEMLAGDGMFQHFRPLYKGTLIANVKMDRERGNRLIAEGLADLVAFGRPYSANPDLVQRFAESAPLAEVAGTPSTFRGPTAIPITQPINHPNTTPGAEHAKDNPPTEQGDRSRSLRHSLQSTRLRNSRTLLVAEVHSTQRAYCTGTRMTVRSGPFDARYAAL